MRVGRLLSLTGLVTAATILLPGAARSQEPARASPLVALEGKKVRLLTPAVVSGRIEGVVLETDPQALLIGLAEGSRLKVPRKTITRLEMSTGRRRHTLTGMWIGAGAFVLLATPIVMGGHGSGREVPLAALAGAIWGAGIGTLVGGERWSTLPLDQVAFGPAGRAASARLAFTVRF